MHTINKIKLVKNGLKIVWFSSDRPKFNPSWLLPFERSQPSDLLLNGLLENL